MFSSKGAIVYKGIALLALVGGAAGFSVYCLSAVRAELPGNEPKSKSNPAKATSTAEDRKVSARKLQTLTSAMHAYLDQYGQFPPAALFSKDGRPLLSWRVLVLPFVGEAKLFREFKLDEPWDSVHNKKLLSRMPAVYSAPQVETKEPHATFYQVFTGKDTIFEGPRGVRISDITDGTSTTILMIEAAEAVPWTRPADLHYDPKKPLPALGGLFPDGFHLARADGSVQFCKRRFRERELRLMITRNDGVPLSGQLDD